MKRKLNESDVPEPDDTETPKPSRFAELGLDTRLLQAVAKHNFSTPTAVQAQAIPLALAGKDILARSQTGSGKTAAYVLPILHSILQRKASQGNEKTIAVLILVPTRELAQQTSKAITSFSSYCANCVRTVDLAQKVPDTVQRTWLAESPDIVVATPARATQCINNSSLSLDNIRHLIIDEADLVLSYGYDEDLQVISSAIPKGVQTTLMSATLSTDLDTLKGLFCRDVVVVDLQEMASDSSKVTQYTVKCSEDDKFLLIYVIFKLKLIKGKCIVFVGDIDRCYRVKLFLEQFGIKSCVLNSELPVNSRIHVVEEFNKDVYNIIVASDEHEVMGERDPPRRSASAAKDTAIQEDGEANTEKDGAAEEVDTISPPKKRKNKTKSSKEYGISRGIDFQNVAAVLNFDFPPTAKSYTHRIGRTARAGKTGLALSFIVPASLYTKNPQNKLTTTTTTTSPATTTAAEHDELILAEVTTQQSRLGHTLEPYNFSERHLSAFRYRHTSALRAVTRTAIRDARTSELRSEILKSEKLKRHFEEHPDDLRSLLRHDGELHSARVQPHLKHVPDYLMPNNNRQGGLKEGGEVAGGREGDGEGEGKEAVGFVGFRKETEGRNRRRNGGKGRMGKNRMVATKRADPLKTFNARGRGKK